MSRSGAPAHRSVRARKFFTCRLRSRSIAWSSVGPSTPQFQLRLKSLPSRLSSAFAALCLPLYTRHEDMPVVVRLIAGRIERNHRTGPRIVDAVEEHQLNTRAAFREHAEVDACRVNAGAERVRAAASGYCLSFNPGAVSHSCSRAHPRRNRCPSCQGP